MANTPRGALLGVLAVVLTTGCSLPLPGGELLTGYVSSDPSGRWLRRVALGLDLHLGEAWNGLSVGWSESLLVRAGRVGASPPVGPATLSFAPPLALSLADGARRRTVGWVFQPAPAPLDPADPIALCLTRVGVSFTVHAGGWSFLVGYGVTTHVLVHRDVHGAFLFRFSSAAPEATSLDAIELPPHGDRPR